MALLRKTSVNVLKHLKKLASDLDQIATLEEADLLKANEQILRLEARKTEHQKEVALALKVADNIRVLIGEKE